MDVTEKLKESFDILKEIDSYNNLLLGENGYISTCDKKIDYWEHYIELKPLKVTEAYKILREIKRLRIMRRKYKNDAELIKVLNDNSEKLKNINFRGILLTQVHKTKTRQDNAKYSYDAYTDDEINDILGSGGKNV